MDAKLKTKFSEAKKVSVTDEIVNQIRYLIHTGELKPGDKLPSQREMEVMFNVSRPTLQKAISKLIALGTIEAMQGKGYYISYIKDITISTNIPLASEMHEDKFFELYQAKMYLEATLAQLAVYNATDSEVQKLLDFVYLLDGRVLDSEDASISGNQFHQMIADFSHNQTLADFEKSLLILLNEYEHSFIKANIRSFEKYERVPHHKIAEAIYQRDGDRAFQEAYNHVRNYMLDMGWKNIHSAPKEPYFSSSE